MGLCAAASPLGQQAGEQGRLQVWVKSGGCKRAHGAACRTSNCTPSHTAGPSRFPTSSSAAAPSSVAHHRRHKLWLRHAVVRGGLKHLAGAFAHHRQAHGGAPRCLPALDKHRGGFGGGDAHPVKVGRPLRQDLRLCGGRSRDALSGP